MLSKSHRAVHSCSSFSLYTHAGLPFPATLVGPRQEVQVHLQQEAQADFHPEAPAFLQPAILQLGVRGVRQNQNQTAMRRWATHRWATHRWATHRWAKHHSAILPPNLRAKHLSATPLQILLQILQAAWLYRCHSHCPMRYRSISVSSQGHCHPQILHRATANPPQILPVLATPPQILVPHRQAHCVSERVRSGDQEHFRYT